MDRKPLWSSWSSFSPSLTFTLSLRFNHSPSSPSSLPSSLHQRRSAFSALAVKQPRCCSTNFSHPFIPAIRPFPKSTLSQRGKLLATDYSYIVISPCFASRSASFASLLLCLPILFVVYPWLPLVSLASSSSSPSFYTLLTLFLATFSFLPWYYWAVLQYYPLDVRRTRNTSVYMSRSVFRGQNMALVIATALQKGWCEPFQRWSIFQIATAPSWNFDIFWLNSFG